MTIDSDIKKARNKLDDSRAVLEEVLSDIQLEIGEVSVKTADMLEDLAADIDNWLTEIYELDEEMSQYTTEGD